MTTRDTTWPEGTPAWADLMVPDRHKALDFYGGLFGWDFTEGSPETGYYTQGLKAGRTVAGIGEAPPGADSPPAVWTTYLAADAVEPVVDRATSAGGSVIMPAMGIEEFGRMAVLADPTGAVFGLWEGGSHTGAQVVNEHGAMVWNEGLTRDVAAATDFYREVFGYTLQDIGGDGFDYSMIEVDGNVVGGVGGMPPGTPDEVPPHWKTYFQVDDVDAAAARVTELGGQVLGEPHDYAFGRMVDVVGPFGEPFALITPPAG